MQAAAPPLNPGDAGIGAAPIVAPIRRPRGRCVGSGHPDRTPLVPYSPVPPSPPASPLRLRVEGPLVFDGDTALPLRPSPNQGGTLVPRFLMIHYTASHGFEETLDWFLDPDARASAHFLVGRDGRIVQLVGLDRRAWHAGDSDWQGLMGLNAYAVGIELVNAGRLRAASEGWVSWAGRRVPDEEVGVATHKHGGPEAGWQDYTEAQLDAVLDLCLALHAALPLEDVLGHDDVAPGRKQDPGPLFPMAALRARLFGSVPRD